MQEPYYSGNETKNSGSALMIFFVKCKRAVQYSAVSSIKHSKGMVWHESDIRVW